MRILQYCESFSPLSETFVYDLIDELERQGVDNYVATLRRVNPENRPFHKLYLITTQERFNPERLFHRVLVEAGIGHKDESTWPGIRRNIGRIVRAIRPDVIHAQFGPSGVLIAPVADRFKIPLVVTFHGFDATRLAKSEYWQRKYHELWPVAAAVVGPSRHICERLRQLGAPEAKILRVGYGANLSEFPYTSPADRFDGVNVRCLFVGRLVEKKGPLLLARAFQIAVKEVAQPLRLSLDVVGDGPLAPKLRQFIDGEGLSSVIRMHGALDHNAVKALFGRAHMYVQHSVTAEDGDEEGQPVALIEASACGLPIVSTRHDGIPDVVIDGKTGFLAEEKDFESMGRKIANLASHPDLWRELGRNGRAEAEENMNLQRQTTSWSKLYARLASSARP
jgi:colanic acid/amylovoran biosynthesis glycosyltransferase